MEADGIYLDYSKQRVTAETISLLLDLALESKLADLAHALEALGGRRGGAAPARQFSARVPAGRAPPPNDEGARASAR